MKTFAFFFVVNLFIVVATLAAGGIVLGLMTWTGRPLTVAAQGEGFDLPTIRVVLKLRRMKPHDRSEQEELLEIYKSALGMI